MYDLIIVGAGPAGLYTAYKLKMEKPESKILIIERGLELSKRKCPAIKANSNCRRCNVCSIMSGVAGAGAFSDGKFPITNDFGGSLWEKIGKEKSLTLQEEVDKINYNLFSNIANPSDYPRMYSSKDSIYKKICTQHNLHLLDAEIRHLGTDIVQQIFEELYNDLVKSNVEFLFDTNVMSIEKLVTKFKVHTQLNLSKLGSPVELKIFDAKRVVIATGRSGSKWVNNLCKNLDIPTKSNKVDIGIRFECPNEIWSHVTKDLYESKIVYKTKTYEDTVRTFCMNPAGSVVTENTNGLITVNGHAFESSDKKTENTNFALLVSQTFTEPFDDSNEYGNAIVRLSNMLGGGVIVQRYGDLIRGKRSTKEHIKDNTVHPTLKAEPGDLSLVLPKRILDDIIEMIEKLDHLVPGMKNDDNLLYGVEVKNYNSIVDVDENLETIYDGLYIIGDCSGWTHSLSQASAAGLYVGEVISKLN